MIFEQVTKQKLKLQTLMHCGRNINIKPVANLPCIYIRAAAIMVHSQNKRNFQSISQCRK